MLILVYRFLRLLVFQFLATPGRVVGLVACLVAGIVGLCVLPLEAWATPGGHWAWGIPVGLGALACLVAGLRLAYVAVRARKGMPVIGEVLDLPEGDTTALYRRWRQRRRLAFMPPDGGERREIITGLPVESPRPVIVVLPNGRVLPALAVFTERLVRKLRQKLEMSTPG